MRFKVSLPLLAYIIFSVQAFTEQEFEQYVNGKYQQDFTTKCANYQLANFNYANELGNELLRSASVSTSGSSQLDALLKMREWQMQTWSYFKDIEDRQLHNYSESLQRQIKFHRVLSYGALDEVDFAKLMDIKNQADEIYETAKICPHNNQNCDLKKDGISLSPDIVNITSTSMLYDRLAYLWTAWRQATGPKVKTLFKTFVDLSNKEAYINGFRDKTALLKNTFEDFKFTLKLDKLWNQVRPFYEEMRKYVGRRLKDRYPLVMDFEDGLIPAHVFGDMWAESWTNIAQEVSPFPEVEIRVDSVFDELGYTPFKIIETADEFFQSLGMLPMYVAYDQSIPENRSRLTDPTRKANCRTGSYYFCDQKTYRIRMCNETNLKYFLNAHRVLASVQNYMQYKHQPAAFRKNPIPGFMTAIGEAVVLSVATPSHLIKLNLLDRYSDSFEDNINGLMKIALNKVVSLPYYLLSDKWRWDIFSGLVPEEKWNEHWWNYRRIYQGVKPPVSRSDDTDFDPGAKPNFYDTENVKFFLANILQFQIYRSLCITAGQYDPVKKTTPLYKCDFYNSTAAGNRLRKAMQLGASRPWKDVLPILTENRGVSAKPLLEYFDPLYRFLKSENEKFENAVREMLKPRKQVDDISVFLFNLNDSSNRERSFNLFESTVDMAPIHVDGTTVVDTEEHKKYQTAGSSSSSLVIPFTLVGYCHIFKPFYY